MKSTVTCPHGYEGDPWDCPKCLLTLFDDDDEHDLMPENLGEFRLEERLGRGASAEVWRAFQEGPNRTVALKIFLDPKLGGHVDRDRFELEVSILGKLNHPNIVPVYLSGEEGGFLYLASRWMKGGSLEQSTSGAMKSREKQRKSVLILRKITRAVAYAHRHGLVHRDIKPANILLDEDGEPHLADFGIAISDEDLEQVGVAGTPAYMAPEQMNGGVVSNLVDLHGLGALHFDLLTGAPPSKNESIDRKSLASIDKELQSICLKCLKRDPADRYQTANQLADDYDHWIKGEVLQSHPVNPLTRLGKWAFRHPGLAALSTLTLASLIVLIVTLLMGSKALLKERNEAQSQEKRALKLTEERRLASYAADIFSANQALQNNQLGLARSLLGGQRPAKEDPDDLREMTWHLLHSRSRDENTHVFRDHGASVTALAFSPDGNYLASGGIDHKVFVRKLGEETPLLSFPRRDSPNQIEEIPILSQIALQSPTIRNLLFTRQLDPDEYRMRSRPSQMGIVSLLQWSPDGKQLFVGCRGSFVRVFGFPDGKLFNILPLGWCVKLTYTGDQRYLVAWNLSAKKTFSLLAYDASTLALVHSIEDIDEIGAVHKNLVAFRKLESGSLRIIDLPAKKVLYEWPLPGGYKVASFSKDGKELYLARPNGGIEVRKIATGAQVKKAMLPGIIHTFAKAPEGIVAAGSQQLIYWPGKNGMIYTGRKGHEGEIISLARHPQGTHWASGSKDHTVRLWGPEPASGILKTERDQPKEAATKFIGPLPQKIALEMKSKEAVGISKNGKVIIETRQTETELKVIGRAVGSPGDVLYSHKLTLPTDSPHSFVMSADGSHFALWRGKDHAMVIHESATGELSWTIPGFRSREAKFVLAPGGRAIAKILWPNRVQLGVPGSGWQEQQQLTSGVFDELVFSNDASWFAIGTDENTILVIDSASGKLLRTLTGSQRPVDQLAISPDGQTLVAMTRGKRLRFWHLKTWRELGSIEHGKPSRSIHLLRDSKTIVIADGQGNLTYYP